jgi:hypothetical protein
MTTYQATVERDGHWWMISVPAIDGLTQARSLAEAEKMARSLIAVSLDIDSTSFDVHLVLQGVGDVADVAAEVNALAALRDRATNAEREATTKATTLAKRLAAQGITVRDIGAILGVSFQRAHQLATA